MSMRNRKINAPSIASYESHFEHTALFEFSKVINSSLDPKFVFSHILLTIMGKLLSPKGMIVLEESKGNFVIEMVKGFPQDFTGTTISITNIPKSLFDVDKLTVPRHPWIKFFKKAGVKMLLPMFILDKPIGFLGFGRSFSKRKLKEKETTFLRSLANISATAVEKTRTIDEIRQVNRRLDGKIQELNTLFELGKEFSASLDPEKLIKLLVFSLLGQIGVNRYLICVRDGPDMKIAVSRTNGAVPQSELLMTLARVKVPTLISQFTVKHEVDPRDTLLGMGLTVIIPMQIQGETKGLILLGDKLSKEPFGKADFEFLSSLSSLAIVSLENARLLKEAIEKQKMEDELLIAREIQKGLLPSVLPSIPGMDIGAANISSKQVGGDYYDLISLPDGRHIVAIGDVSGKGTPAALLMANLQATIRALVPLGLPLSALTEKVNDLMCHNTGGTKFVTFFWGILDHHEQLLTFVNAGHNYPYLFHSDGSIDRLDKGGMILGVRKGLIAYEQASVKLRPGDILVLFTDGVTEAMSKDSIEYGEQRLESVVRTNQATGSQQIIEAIHRDIVQHVGGRGQSDDITMMVVKVG